MNGVGKFIEKIHLAQYGERWRNAAGRATKPSDLCKRCGEFLEQLSDCLFLSNSSVAARGAVLCTSRRFHCAISSVLTPSLVHLFCGALGA